MSAKPDTANRHWVCKKCGGVSDIRANRCQNPKCCAILALEGQIVFEKSIPRRHTPLMIAVTVLVLVLLGGYWMKDSQSGESVRNPDETASQSAEMSVPPVASETQIAPETMPLETEPAVVLSPAEEAWQRTQQIMAAAAPIGAGGIQTVVLCGDGTAIACGDSSNYGSCNVYGWENLVAVSSGDFFTLGLFEDGTVDAVGDNRDSQCNVDSWSDIVAIAAGDFHSVGLRSDGTVVAVGRRDDGQCSVGSLNARVTEDVKIIAVAASFNHTAVLYSDGTVRAVGSNLQGQCDTQSWTDVVAVYAGVKFTLGLRSDGTVLAAGDNSDGRSNVTGWQDVVMLAAGDFHSVGITSDGRILHTGLNTEGQRNLSGWDGSEIVALGAGCRHTVALTRNGTILAAGENKYYQCELDGVNVG